MSLCTVPSLDILEERIFIHLDIRDILNLIDTNQHLAYIGINYLKKLKIINFSKRSQEEISDRHFNILHENCKNVVDLNFDDCFWVCGDQFEPLVENNKDHLEKITLKSCPELEFDDMNPITECMSLKEIQLGDLTMCTKEDLEDLEQIFFENFNDYWGDLIDNQDQLKSKMLNLKFIIDGRQGLLVINHGSPIMLRRRDQLSYVQLNQDELESIQFSDLDEIEINYR